MWVKEFNMFKSHLYVAKSEISQTQKWLKETWVTPTPVTYFTKEVSPSIAKPPVKINGVLPELG